MKILNIYQKVLRRNLAEHGFTIHEQYDNTFSLNLNEVSSKEIKIRLIVSEPAIERIHGSKNNTEIKAIGFFKFRFSPEGLEPNFYVFAFNNTIENKVEFIIIPYGELISRLNARKRIINDHQEIDIVFWLMPDKCLFDCIHPINGILFQ